ncbi:polymeric immunoglobulin receptor-like [Fundulus diaphanus]
MRGDDGPEGVSLAALADWKQRCGSGSVVDPRRVDRPGGDQRMPAGTEEQQLTQVPGRLQGFGTARGLDVGDHGGSCQKRMGTRFDLWRRGRRDKQREYTEKGTRLGAGIWSAALSSAAGLIRVFGYEGRDVNVSCTYDQGYEKNEKYFCKNDCNTKDILIKTTQNRKNKYFISDDKKKRTITVTISDLHSNAAGKYQCGVSKWFKDIYTEVKLEVKKDRCCNTENKIQGDKEGSVSISCPYDSESVDKLKYICRGNRPSTCLQQAVITSNNRENGRFRLTDDTKSRIFTVNISNLTLKDSGAYLCGTQRNSGMDVFSAVQMEVKELLCLKSYDISGLVGHAVTLQCPNPPEQRDRKKFLCKREQHNNCTDMMENQMKFMLHNVSSSCFSMTITDLEAADAGTYFCGSDSQLSYIKINLTVVSPHQTSSVASISTAEQVTSQPPSTRVPDVTLFYILPTVLALLLFLTFVLLMVLKYKQSRKPVDGVKVNASSSAGDAVEMTINDIYDLHEDQVYMNCSSPPNMLSHEDNDVYSNTLYRSGDLVQ